MMNILADMNLDDPVMAALRAAYGVNLLILLPVIHALRSPVEGGITLPASLGISYAGFRGLTGSYWLAIAILSVAGLIWPMALMPLLALQVIYKAGFLAGTEWPSVRRGDGLQTNPVLVALFAMIVLAWPVLLGWVWWTRLP